MRTAYLRGREHTKLGAVAAIAEGSAAIALSRGGAAKRYAHRDPNEDVAAFAVGEAGVLLAVADGHGGCDAAEIAVERLLERHAKAWTQREAPALRSAWESTAREAILGANTAILERLAGTGVESARTTLAFALARPDQGWLAFASLGDSHVFRAGGGPVVDLAARDGRLCFLGHAPETEKSLREKCVVGSEALGSARALVLVTDGISERGIGVEVPEDAVADALHAVERRPAELRSLEAARGVVERALDAHRRHDAGDNVSSSVVWLPR